jgi:hypothetical protein
MIMSVVLCEFCGIFGLKSGTKGKPAPMFWSRLGWGETEGHPVLIGAGAFLIVRLSTRFRRSPVARRAFLSSLLGHAKILAEFRISLTGYAHV